MWLILKTCMTIVYHSTTTPKFEGDYLVEGEY